MTVIFPQIPTPSQDIQSLTQTVLALQQAVNILIGNGENAAVTQNTFAETAFGLNSSIQTTNSSITSISEINSAIGARYSVTVNNNNLITGFSLLSNGSGASSFNIAADSFNIYASGTSATSIAANAVFSISTINGVAQLTINGNNLGDLSTLNNAIGNNAISHAAVSTGTGSSGNATMTDVRAGARILVIVSYFGGDVVGSVGGSLSVTVNGSNVGSALVPSDQNGAFFTYHSTSAIISYISAGGTEKASCSINIASSSAVSTYIQELSK